MLTVELPTVHVYAGVREPSSASVTVAEHVNSVPVYTPEDGVMEASTSKTGAVLSMVILAVSLTEAPLLSVNVTEQVMLSSGLEMVESSWSVASLPSVALVVVLVHE